jgi:hypothetical protein
MIKALAFWLQVTTICGKYYPHNRRNYKNKVEEKGLKKKHL